LIFLAVVGFVPPVRRCGVVAVDGLGRGSSTVDGVPVLAAVKPGRIWQVVLPG